MPFCSRIGEFRLLNLQDHWDVVIHTPSNPHSVDFGAILKSAFRGTQPKSTGDSFGNLANPWKSRFSIPVETTGEAEIHGLLRILKWTVTISDDADESHAVELHNLPHPSNDPSKPNWKRTRIGKLTHEAKSYNPFTGDKKKAFQLAKEIESWIYYHPGYRTANTIVAAPPGNRSKRYDLPEFITGHLSKVFGYSIVSCTSAPLTQAQKSLDDPQALHLNVSGKFHVPINLNNQHVIILDDIYRSGETIKELIRACRTAGAKTVLSLAATKTPKYCNGVAPSNWYEIYKEAGLLND